MVFNTLAWYENNKTTRYSIHMHDLKSSRTTMFHIHRRDMKTTMTTNIYMCEQGLINTCMI